MVLFSDLVALMISIRVLGWMKFTAGAVLSAKLLGP